MGKVRSESLTGSRSRRREFHILSPKLARMIHVRERLQLLDRGVTVYRPEYQGSFLKVAATLPIRS
jgi:hypothetical protein